MEIFIFNSTIVKPKGNNIASTRKGSENSEAKKRDTKVLKLFDKYHVRPLPPFFPAGKKKSRLRLIVFYFNEPSPLPSF